MGCSGHVHDAASRPRRHERIEFGERNELGELRPTAAEIINQDNGVHTKRRHLQGLWPDHPPLLQTQASRKQAKHVRAALGWRLIEPDDRAKPNSRVLPAMPQTVDQGEVVFCAIPDHFWARQDAPEQRFHWTLLR